MVLFSYFVFLIINEYKHFIIYFRSTFTFYFWIVYIVSHFTLSFEYLASQFLRRIFILGMWSFYMCYRLWIFSPDLTVVFWFCLWYFFLIDHPLILVIIYHCANLSLFYWLYSPTPFHQSLHLLPSGNHPMVVSAMQLF